MLKKKERKILECETLSMILLQAAIPLLGYKYVEVKLRIKRKKNFPNLIPILCAIAQTSKNNALMMYVETTKLSEN